MKKRLLQRILWQKKNRWELGLAGVGFLLGLVLFLFCIQVYFDIDAIFNRRLSLETQLDYLIISKKLNPDDLLLSRNTGFSAEELSELQALPFTLDLGVVQSNRFAARAGVEIFGKGFLTELFFEAVEERFLDTLPESWQWTEQSRFVPVIISRDFLMLYNFGFSRARGFPLLSEDMLKLVPVSLEISGTGGHRTLKAQIVGLSDRVASILVPYSFMEWANTHYSNVEEFLPARLILSVKDRSDPEIIRYLEEKEYETSKEKLRLSDAGFTIKIVLSLIAVIGLILITLSFVIFLTTFRLIVSRSRTEIQLLSDLGYTSGSLVKSLMLVLVSMFAVILMAAVLVLIPGISAFHSFLTGNGFQLPGFAHPLVPVLGGLLIVLALFFNYLSVLRSMVRCYARKK